MQYKQCSRGHFYDSVKHVTCPYCGVPDLDVPGITKGKRKEEAGAPLQSGLAETVPKRENKEVEQEGRTMGIIQKTQGIDPVVGWLVCVEGADRGKDFKIRSENNFIGKLSSNDIAISGDDAVSKEKHAVISFDPQNTNFVLQSGTGRGLVYLNTQPVYTPTELAAFDKIKLGQTVLIFVPLCGEQFKWEAPQG